MRYIFKAIKPFEINHIKQLSLFSCADNSRNSSKFSKSKYAKSIQYNCNQEPKLLLQNNFRYKLNLSFEQNRWISSDSSVSERPLRNLQNLTTTDFLKTLKEKNISRCCIINVDGEVKYSHTVLEDLIPESVLQSLEFDHEAIFFCRGTRSNCLLAVFLWRTHRGQGVGGVDYRPVSNMAEMIVDGNRFSKGLGIKSALAGMWAGGGKGIIAAPEERQFDRDFRRRVFLDFGDFLTSLNGCMVAGAGIGSSKPDMDTMFSETRYVSNISPDYGGSVNTAMYTGLGVVRAMEAAIEFLQMGSLAGKTVAIQGAGNVGQVIIDELLKKGVRHIYATECNIMRVGDVRDMFAQKADGRLTISKVSFEDMSIFRTRCDIFSPCARGKVEKQVLNDTTIPMLDTKIICGACNLPVHTEDDHIALMEKKITYVTDVVPNRMGIVSKLLEPYGRMQLHDDHDMLKHLSRDWPHSIYQTTLRILRLAAEHKIHPEKAAYILGEELGREDHPLYPHRTQSIIRELLNSGWHEGKDYWNQIWNFEGDHDHL